MGRTTTSVSIAAVALLALTACAPDGSDTTSPTTTRPTSASTSDTRATGLIRGGLGSSRLLFFSDCNALLDHLRTITLDRVTAWGLGGGAGGPAMYDAVAGGMAREAASDSTVGRSTAAPPATTNDGTGFSQTNTQEVGVDEGDTVETDGTHVFVASADGVRIVSVDDARVIATLELPQGSHQLLLDGTRLAVITTPWSGSRDTVVSLFDVSDAPSPSLLERNHLEGSVTATRSIDGIARIVLTSFLADRLPFVRPDQFGWDEARALAENRRIIESSTIDDWMPRSFEVDSGGTFGPMSTALDCSGVAAPADFSGLGITWIASLDLRGNGAPTGTAGIVSSGDTVYASTDNLYVATQPWDAYWPVAADDSRSSVPAPSVQPPTIIHQFALEADGGARYVASGEVPGRLLNQFSMSELDGDLRVAITKDDWSGSTPSVSSVHVLRPDGTELKDIGSVSGLGVTEQIYSVRFLGDRAYVVTFRQTDPLYVVDLSDPTAPTVEGELKIPGYSAYLHPVGDHLLLGVGQSATDEGRTLGTQLSLFDVSDPAAPKQVSTLLVGGWSDAEWDHHAFLYWPEDGTIVIPTSPYWAPCPADASCVAASLPQGQPGLVVAQLQGDQLVAKGVVADGGDPAGRGGCWNPSQRSLVIGSELVAVGMDHVTFVDRETLTARDRTAWSTADQYGCYYSMG
ncbi:MAG: beta-propeller domain-containing protein [Ilumatobacteraceae bacterium]